jgi:photosystem II stability/assembly factor-like uncharacterized protein
MVRRAAALAVLCCGVLLLAACGASANWSTVGPQGDEIILSLAADPHQSGLIYAGGSDGHIYRYKPSASSDLFAGAGVPAHSQINALLPDPQTPGLIYAATKVGLLASTDSGDAWVTRGSGFPAHDQMQALTFGSRATTLIAGSQQNGTFVSHDAGKTWQSSSGGLPGNADIYTLYTDTATHTLYAGLVGNGVYLSQDDGQSWSASSQGIPNQADVFMLAELPTQGLAAHGATLYAGTSKGLYASTDQGQHWSAIPTSSGLPTGRVLSLATFATAPGYLYAGTDSTVYRSTDGGRQWQLVAPGLSTHIAAISGVPGKSAPTALVAAAGPLMSYGAVSGGPSIGGFVIIGVVVVFLFLFIQSQRRKLHQSIGGTQPR